MYPDARGGGVIELCLLKKVKEEILIFYYKNLFTGVVYEKQKKGA